MGFNDTFKKTRLDTNKATNITELITSSVNPLAINKFKKGYMMKLSLFIDKENIPSFSAKLKKKL